MWNFSQFSQNTAIIDEEGVNYTYGELQAESHVLYQSIGKRTLVFCLSSNEKGSLLGYVTFIGNGIVPVMLDAELDLGLLNHLLENYRPDFLWLPDRKASQFGYERVCSLWGYTLLKTEYNHEFPLHNDLALLLTTSGSTGSLKLVRQSYKNLLANTKSITECLELDATERPITTLPMNYTYGLSIINSHLYAGAGIILTTKTLVQKEFWQQLKGYEATSFGGVPYTYEILDKLRFFRMELPALRAMTQAGGKLSMDLHRKFALYAEQSHKRFIVMYGQTEATARMSYLPHDRTLEKCGSMGVAIPGGEFSLIDADGNTIADDNVVGELLYRGDNVALGYAERGDDLARGDEWHGVLATGDMAKRDADGFYYIVGRKQRFLKIFGNRVNLDETERMIKAAFPDLDCACGGMDDAMKIFITAETQKAAVASFLSEKTGLNRIAFNVVYIKKIPRNESGKILYPELEARDDI
jgi:acyl-CoA synthetase (AMP-forming)/AMP-acid ligase II